MPKKEDYVRRSSISKGRQSKFTYLHSPWHSWHTTPFYFFSNPLSIAGGCVLERNCSSGLSKTTHIPVFQRYSIWKSCRQTKNVRSLQQYYKEINKSNKVKIKTEIQNARRHSAHQCNCPIFSPALRPQRLSTALGVQLPPLLPSQNRKNSILDLQVKRLYLPKQLLLFVLDKYVAPHSGERQMKIKPIPVPAKHSLLRVLSSIFGNLSQHTPAHGQLATLGTPLKEKDSNATRQPFGNCVNHLLVGTINSFAGICKIQLYSLL